MEIIPVLSFLKDLKENNNKEWFDANRKRYEASRKLFLALVAQLIEGLAQIDPALTGVDPKKCVFRINRDIRFSKDKTPYKTNFGALLGSEGRKTEGTGFYIHLAPGFNFVGGGVYKPQPESLKGIRQEIDYNPKPLLELIQSSDFKETFNSIQGEQLKTSPKGYPLDHPNIELLRYKSYYVMKEFADNEVGRKDFEAKALEVYGKANKFNEYLKLALG